MNILAKTCALSFVYLAFGSMVAVAGAELVIEPNTTYTVKADQKELLLDVLKVGDNAVIQFDADVNRWHVEAFNVSIGKNVVINGLGRSGDAGAVGKSASGVAPECSDGKSGEDGGHGRNGSDGVSLSMRLTISEIGDVIINNAGGIGGKGGRGGAGQPGGVIKRCKGPDGGSGGQGGDGGDGGNGGNVHIVYSFDAAANISKPLSAYVTINNKGGVAGKGASGGNGGKGTEGKYINMRTLTGSKKWMPAGTVGDAGRSGKAGRLGIVGQALLSRDFEGRLNTLVNAQSQQESSVQSIQALVLKEQQEAALKSAAAVKELASVNAELVKFKQQSLDLSKQLSALSAQSQQNSSSAENQVSGLNAKVVALDTALALANEQLVLSRDKVAALSAEVASSQAKLLEDVALVQAAQKAESARYQEQLDELLKRLEVLEKRPAQTLVKEKVVEKVVEKPASVSPAVVKEIVKKKVEESVKEIVPENGATP